VENIFYDQCLKRSGYFTKQGLWLQFEIMLEVILRMVSSVEFSHELVVSRLYISTHFVHLSACLFHKGSYSKRKWQFPRAGVTGVPVFSGKGQGSWLRVGNSRRMAA